MTRNSSGTRGGRGDGGTLWVLCEGPAARVIDLAYVPVREEGR